MSDEITVRLKCSLDEIYNILENKKFKVVDKYLLSDEIYVLNNIDINKFSIRELLSNYILLRNIKQYEGIEFKDSYNVIKLTNKKKDIASNGDIISQDKIDCEIKNIEEGKKFIEAIGYKKLINITEDTVVYGKNKLEIAIKNIEDEYNLIEIEVIEENEKYNTINKLKQVIKELNVPIDESNFFVKKVENKLKKILGEL